MCVACRAQKQLENMIVSNLSNLHIVKVIDIHIHIDDRYRRICNMYRINIPLPNMNCIRRFLLFLFSDLNFNILIKTINISIAINIKSRRSKEHTSF